MFKEKLHFWYSEKQRKIMRERKKELNCALINGKKVRYTECNKEKKRSSWDDYVYLGRGTIHSIGRQQKSVSHKGDVNQEVR